MKSALLKVKKGSNAMRSIFVVVLFAMLTGFVPASAEEPVHWDVVQQFMEESFERSEVLETASWLTDVFGPRNTKSASYLAAANWARDTLAGYGLDNAHLDGYEFGIGYAYEYVSVHMMAPQYMPIIAYPAPWSASTKGKVTGHAVYLDYGEIEEAADLEAWRGKLKDAVILTHPIQQLSPHFEPMAQTWTKAQLDEMAKTPVGSPSTEERRGRRSREPRLPWEEITKFVFDEGALALVRTDGKTDFGSVVVGLSRYIQGTKPWQENGPPPPTELIMSAEHYNRIMRILEKNLPVELELDIQVSVNRDGTQDHNVIAEIPGTDLADEIVLLGAHLQAWPAGTGATDNAAGSSVALEVMRMFQALDIKPRRTVRIGLWGGHEIGLVGNRSYVSRTFADFAAKEYKKDYHNLSAYFNLDHGNGKIRAVTVVGNEVLRSIFSEWIKPLQPLGMEHLFSTSQHIGGNPGIHDAYGEVGLAGFYFYQERLDMNSHVHGNMDVFDRIVGENLQSNAVVLATFVYHAAMRDEKLPRVLPLPW